MSVPFGATWSVLRGEAVADSDSFDRANSTTSLGTTDTGQTWSALSGTWGISSNQAYLVSTTGQAVAVFDTGQADGTLSCTVTPSPTNNRADCGLIFRAADDNNYLLVTLDKNAAGGPPVCNLYKRIAGIFTLLSGTTFGVVNGTPNLVEVFLRGASVTVKVDGSTIHTYSSSTGLEANTKVGLRVNAAALADDGGSRFNDLSFTRSVSMALPLQSAAVDDPLGIAPSAFDDSAWPVYPGAFATGGSGAGIAVPQLISIGSNGSVLFQTDIGIDGEAYYRKHVGALGAVTVKGWIDNQIWVFINGTLEFTLDTSGGDEWEFPYTFTDPDNVVAIRSRSTGDNPNGGHLMAIQIGQRRGWVQDNDRW